MPCNCGCRCHWWANKMRTPAAALSPFKIAITSSKRIFAFAKHVIIHREAHRTTCVRHSKPASTKISASPSSSACFFTSIEPGTTNAFTRSLTLYPRTTFAAARRSSIREFVHEPINALSTRISDIRRNGSNPMYCKRAFV